MTPQEEIKSLLEEQSKAFNEFKLANDLELLEIKKNGNASATTATNVANIGKRMDEIADQLKSASERADKLEAAVNRIGSLGSFSGGVDADEVKNAVSFSRVLGKPIDVENVRQYNAALNSYLRSGEKGLTADVLNTLRVGIDSDGGYWVQPTMSARIIRRIYETSPIRQYASVETISTDSLKIPFDNGEFGSGWVGEEEARPDTTTPKLGDQEIVVNEQYASPKVTQKLLDDAAVDVEAWIAQRVADRFARQENAAFVAGNGIRKPKGLLNYATAYTADSAGRAWGVVETVKSGASGAFASSNPGDRILDLVYALKAAYRQGAVFLSSRATVGAIRKLKDGQGNYLWQPMATAGQPASIMGFPVLEGEDMPALASASTSLLFGNLKEAYQIVDRIGIRILRDPYTDKPYVKFYTTKRVGGGVVNSEAYKIMVFSA